MAGSWLLALVVPPPPESGRSGTNTLASDTTNSDPAGHAEVTTSDHHHRGLNDDDDNDDDLNTKENDESVSSERQKYNHMWSLQSLPSAQCFWQQEHVCMMMAMKINLWCMGTVPVIFITIIINIMIAMIIIII